MESLARPRNSGNRYTTSAIGWKVAEVEIVRDDFSTKGRAATWPLVQRTPRNRSGFVIVTGNATGVFYIIEKSFDKITVPAGMAIETAMSSLIQSR